MCKIFWLYRIFVFKLIIDISHVIMCIITYITNPYVLALGFFHKFLVWFILISFVPLASFVFALAADHYPAASQTLQHFVPLHGAS